MKKKQGHPSRLTRFVFYPIIGAVFVAVLTAIIILAVGYKPTIQGNHISLEKTGMIIVSSKPTDARVYLNGRDLKKKTRPFIATKINSLLPGDYLLEIKKSGYHEWKKNVRVYADLVSWANYVLLFPKDIKKEKIDKLSGYKIVSTNKTNRYFFVESTKGGAKTYKLYDTSSNEIKEIWPQNFSPVEPWLQKPEVLSAEFSSDSKKILLKLKNGQGYNYGLLYTDSSRLKSLTTNPQIIYNKVVWNANDNNELIGISKGALYSITADLEPNPATFIDNSVIDFSPFNGAIYYVANINNNYLLNRVQSDGTHKTLISDSVSKSSKYKFQLSSRDGTIALLAADSGNLTAYYFVDNLFSSIKLGEGIVDMSWNKEGTLVNYFNANNIYCYDWEKQREVSKKTNVNINKMLWYYDNYHLYYQTDNEFGVVDYDGENMIVLGSSSAANLINQSSFIFQKLEENLISYYRINVSF